MDYWLVSYELLKETPHFKTTGFNTCSYWTTTEPVRRTIAIKGSVAGWLKKQKQYPVILHTQKITAKEYKQSI